MDKTYKDLSYTLIEVCMVGAIMLLLFNIINYYSTVFPNKDRSSVITIILFDLIATISIFPTMIYLCTIFPAKYVCHRLRHATNNCTCVY